MFVIFIWFFVIIAISAFFNWSSCFIMLLSFLLYSKVDQPHGHTYPLPRTFLPGLLSVERGVEFPVYSHHLNLLIYKFVSPFPPPPTSWIKTQTLSLTVVFNFQSKFTSCLMWKAVVSCPDFLATWRICACQALCPWIAEPGVGEGHSAPEDLPEGSNPSGSPQVDSWTVWATRELGTSREAPSLSYTHY